MHLAVFNGRHFPLTRRSEEFLAGNHRAPIRRVGPISRSCLVSLAAVSLCLAGCTSVRQYWKNGFKVGPNYCRPPAPVADRWIDDEHPNVRSQAIDYSHWWAVFNDPVLNELVCAAYEQNLPLKVAGLRIIEARAQRGIATGNLLPQTQEMTGSYTRSTFSGNARFGAFSIPKVYLGRWANGFDAAWELDFWGRFRRQIEAADADLNAQIENYDDVLVILQAEVAATYVEIRTLQQRLEYARRNLDLQRQTLKVTEVRHRVGQRVTALPVEQARTNAAVTESAIPLLKTSLRQAQNRLCILLGIPPQRLPEDLGNPRPIPYAPAEVVVGIPAELLRRRPDVRRAEREAAAQSARVGVATSEFYPHISITGNIGVEAERLSRLYELNSIAGSIGPSFRWNILNYGRILNNVRVQDVRFQQSVLNYQNTVLKANEEVENAIVAFLNDWERLKPLEVAVEAATNAEKLAMARWEAGGEIDFLTVVDTQRVLVLQQDRLTEGQGNSALSLIAVNKALGGGWPARYTSCRVELGQAEITTDDGPRPVDETPPPVEDNPFEAVPAPRDMPIRGP